MSNSRAVLFDLGNTLVSYYQRPEFPAVLRRCIASALAVGDATSETVDDLLPAALQLNAEAPDFAVTPLTDRIRRLIPGCAGASTEHVDRVCDAFMQPIFETARADPAAAPVLDALRARGIRTAIVSNTPWGSPSALWRAELERHDLLRRVDAAVFCVDVGWRKPHTAPIHRALELLGVPVISAWFVGDDPHWDLEGARRAGIRPILLAPQDTACLPHTIAHLEDILSIVDSAEIGRLTSG